MQLKRKHWNEIETDASEMVWALFGSAVHNILEHGKDDHHIVEERIFAEHEGWKLSGAIDLQEVEEDGIIEQDPSGGGGGEAGDGIEGEGFAGAGGPEQNGDAGAGFEGEIEREAAGAGAGGERVFETDLQHGQARLGARALARVRSAMARAETARTSQRARSPLPPSTAS